METITVNVLSEYIKKRLEKDQFLADIWVSGEISNYTRHNSGHHYFSLKDELSQVKCVMFKSAAKGLTFKPEHGMKVLVRGHVTVFKPHGNYQIVVSEIKKDGQGELHKKYLELKAKLEKEGLFKPENKKELPKFPKCIGVVTSATGAAVRDLTRNITRRFPNINIKIVPTLVQGVNGANDIAEAVKLLNGLPEVDVIIVGRGGGSLEDLWNFNEEVVARAIYASEKPVISAVGHETDFTISDFVADKRAPTPSTAAEIVVPDKQEIIKNITDLKSQLVYKTQYKLDVKSQYLQQLIKRPLFMRPYDFIERYFQQVDDFFARAERAAKNSVELKRSRVQAEAGKLDNLNPKAVLKRGYCIATYNNKILKDVDNIQKEDVFNLLVANGDITGKVMEVKKNE